MSKKRFLNVTVFTGLSNRDEQLEMQDENNQVENVCTYDMENVSSDDDKSSEEEEASKYETVNHFF